MAASPRPFELIIVDAFTDEFPKFSTAISAVVSCCRMIWVLIAYIFSLEVKIEFWPSPITIADPKIKHVRSMDETNFSDGDADKRDAD